jgi:hypothetical protein
MSGAWIDPEVVKIIEEVARDRAKIPSDKSLMDKHHLSRSTLFRIMRSARKKIQVELKQIITTPE